MPSLSKIIILLSCISFLGIHTLQAQLNAYEISFPYSKEVSRIVEDSTGYIWFHDEKEFYRYNGHQVEALGLENAIGKKKFDYNFTGDLIFSKNKLLFEDNESLWVIDPKTKIIKLFWHIPDDQRLDHYYEDDQGGIWVFASSKINTSRPVYHLNNNGASTFVYDLYSYIGSRGIFWDFEINDANGIFFIHWRLGGLIMIDFTGKKVKLNPIDQIDFNSKYACSLFRLDNKNRLWRIYEDEFSIYDFNTRKFTTHPISGIHRFWTECNKIQTPAVLNLRFLYEDHLGNIWLACAASYLVMYDTSLNENFLFRKPLVDELQGDNYDIKSLMEDQHGNLWGNKLGGLFKIRKKANYFTIYAKDTKSPDHPLYSRDNPVVNDILDFFHDFGIKNTSVHSISEDLEGNLYFQDATFTFRIDHSTHQIKILPIFNKKEKVFLNMNHNIRLLSVFDAYYNIDHDYKLTKYATPINKIENVFVQRNGRIWISGLLSQHDFMFGELDTTTHDFLGNFDNEDKIDFDKVKVNSIQEDEVGNLWLGSNEGLLYINLLTRQITNFDRNVTFQNKSYELGRVMDQIHFLEKNKLWFKSKYEVGLLNIDNNEVEALLAINSSISGDDVVFVSEGDSVLWLGEKEGLRYYNFNSNKGFLVSREEGIETAGKVNVMKRLINNDIAIGTSNGLYIFNPNTVLNKISEKVNLELNSKVDLLSYEYVDGQLDSTISFPFLTSSHDIKLNYNDKSLSLTYAIADFKYPRRHIYRHMLDGYDHEWSSPHVSNVTKYNSLPYGNYTFIVEGQIGNGNWARERLEIPITVIQAWFTTWWFIGGTFILFASLIYFFVRYHFRQKLLQRIEMERLRTKLSSDLHDDVGSMLSGLAMQSEVMGLSLNEEDKKTAYSISEMSRSAIDKMRDIVWALDSRRDKYENLIDRMKSFALITLNRVDIAYTFKVNGIEGSRFINPEQRQNIYLIFKEALTNIVKHSSADMVTIELMKNNKELSLVIRDNGAKTLFSKGDGLGLSNMKMRASKLKGKLIISDCDGFEVKLILPQ